MFTTTETTHVSEPEQRLTDEPVDGVKEKKKFDCEVEKKRLSLRASILVIKLALVQAEVAQKFRCECEAANQGGRITFQSTIRF